MSAPLTYLELRACRAALDGQRLLNDDDLAVLIDKLDELYEEASDAVNRDATVVVDDSAPAPDPLRSALALVVWDLTAPVAPADIANARDAAVAGLRGEAPRVLVTRQGDATKAWISETSSDVWDLVFEHTDGHTYGIDVASMDPVWIVGRKVEP